MARGGFRTRGGSGARGSPGHGSVQGTAQSGARAWMTRPTARCLRRIGTGTGTGVGTGTRGLARARGPARAEGPARGTRTRTGTGTGTGTDTGSGTGIPCPWHRRRVPARQGAPERRAPTAGQRPPHPLPPPPLPPRLAPRSAVRHSPRVGSPVCPFPPLTCPFVRTGCPLGPTSRRVGQDPARLPRTLCFPDIQSWFVSVLLFVHLAGTGQVPYEAGHLWAGI